MSKQDRLEKREKLLAAALLLMFVVFIGRLVQLQVIEHDMWTKIGRKQSEIILLEKPNRGEIRDRSGVPLAVTLPLTYAVGYRPTLRADPELVAARLADHLRMTKNGLRAKMRTDGFTYLARRVDMQVKQKLDSLKLPCLQFDEEPRRSYPGGAQAAAVVGFCNVDGAGQQGVEAFMNEELSGAAHRELCRVDARRKSTSPMVYDLPSECLGASVSLTIDVQLQTIVDEAMREEMKGRNYERACAILIEPATGDILALSTLPNFDPNHPGESAAEARKCWPITDVYEPGSTLKVVPIAKALESRKLSRSSMVFCENGSYHVKGAVLHDSHPHGMLSVEDVLAYSSNIGAAKICERFSRADIYEKLRDFGFGVATGVELAGEQAGFLPLISSWSGPTQANLAFGHGISCTPLQLAMAYASIANGGTLMKPRLVKSVDYPSGEHIDFPLQTNKHTMTPAVAAELTEMLVGVVEHGTGELAQVKGIRIAGKTGTAQKVDQVHKTYFSKRFVSSFIGFFPADKPRYVLLVVVDDPRGEYFGASVAAPAFRDVVEEIRVIRPQDFDDSPPPADVEFATRVKRPPVKAPLALETVSYSTAFEDNSSQAGATADTVQTVPNLEGWDFRKAVTEISRRHLSFKISGSRRVVTQLPAPGTRVPAGTVCELYGE